MVSLVPQPRSLTLREGSCDLRRGATLRFDEPLAAAAALARRWVEACLGVGFAVSAGPGKEGGSLPVLQFSVHGGLGPEEYRLDVAPGGIEIGASTAEGAVRGAATLWQLALSEGAAIPALSIADAPRFAWRGAMLDTARNYFTPDFIERFLDLMALHKLNRFHWHLTDDQAWRLEIPGMPELTARGSRRLDRRVNIPRWKEGSYSAADVRRLVAFAAERGIVVVPEIETPGHVTALLASHPELSCAGAAVGGGAFEPEDRYGIFEDVLCAGNEGVFELLGRVFDEVAALFPGPWVHAGGDEVPKARWSTCPRCKALMKRESLRDEGGALEPELLQGWFMNRVAELLAARGKRMVGWDEILEGRVRKDAVIMSWRGMDGGIEAAREGYAVVMSPQTKACYLDHKHLDLPEEPGQLGVCSVADSYAFDPVPEGLDAKAAALILGAQANIWTELMYFGRQVEYMAFPRLCALSEVFWSPKASRNPADFAARLEKHGQRLDRLGVQRYRGPLA